jgi:tetratricopeptide (TPR) repeat protein
MEVHPSQLGSIPMTLRPRLLAACLTLIGMALVWQSPALCTDAAPTPAPETPAATEPPALDPQTLYQILLADVAAQRGEYRLAAKGYLEAAKTANDPRLARRATEAAVYAKDAALSLEAVRLWVELEPDSSRAKQFFAALLVNENEMSEAKTYIAKLLAEEAGDDKRTANNLLQLHRLIGAHSDKISVFKLIRDLAQPYAKFPEAHYAVAQAGLETGLTDARILEVSLSEVERALVLRPAWEPAVVLKAQILAKVDAGRAARVLRDFLTEHPQAKGPRAALADLLVEQRQFAEAREEMQALAKGDSRPELQMAIARVSVRLGDYAEAEDVLHKLLDAGQGDADAIRYYLGQISEDRKRYAEAIVRYGAVEEGEQWWNAQLGIASATAKSGKLDAARAFLHKLEPADEQQRIQIVQTDAQLLREAGQYKAAYDLLGAALAKNPESPDLLYDLAMAAEKLNRLEVVESKLKRLIELKPDSAQAYNALGYTLVDRNVRSQEGLHYIEKAYALSPGDPFILDSMGWALYRVGKLEQSLDYLRRALAQRPDGDIAAHLGEVLWAKGEHAEAQQVWKNQLRETPDNPLLLETIKRFAP